MNSIAKLGVLGVFAAFLALVASTALPTSASPTSLTLNGVATSPQTIALGVNAPVVAVYQDDTPAGTSFVLTISNPAVATFQFGPVTTAGNADLPAPVNAGASITIADDPDALPEATTVNAVLVCYANGTTNLSYTEGGGTSAVIVINCGTGGVGSVSFSNTAPTVGTSLTVTAQCTSAGQTLIATVGNFSGTPTNGTLISVAQINCVAAGTMTATYTCSVAQVVTFTLLGVPAVTLNCGTAGGLVLSATTGSGATVTGTCTAGALLTQTGPATFTAATINGTAVTVAAGSVSCTMAGTLVATFICNTSGVVTLTLGSLTGSFTCSTLYGGYPYGGQYPYTQYPYDYCGTSGQYPYGYNTGQYPYNYNMGQYPYNTGQYPYNYNNYAGTNCYNQQQYSNIPTSLTITSGSPSTACGSNAAITVRVVGQNGSTVADGTAVTLTSSIGTFSPATATTSAGVVQATWTAPSSASAASTAQLKATAGTATNTTSVSVTCAQTTAPSAPVYTAPSSPPPPPSYAPVISPPSTGDAGLAAAILRDEGCID